MSNFMQINIRTSSENKKIVRELTRKLPLNTKENVIARIALGYSLQQGKKFTSDEFAKNDSKGKEYKDHVLFDAKHRDFYIALICQNYHIYKTHEDIPKYVKLHIDHGLEKMNELFKVENYTFFDFLIDHLDKGLSYLSTEIVSTAHVTNRNQDIEVSHFQDPILIEVGKSIDSNSSINVPFNNSAKYSNNHIAVAGSSGTGKTQFALELLSQISEKSNHQVNFIYLDFKGLKEGDRKFYESFFSKTRSKYINVPNSAFPINPLSFIDTINQKNKIMGIDKFVDIICKYSNIGIKQRGTLREATIEAFANKKTSSYPSFKDINECLLDKVGDKRDSLTEIIDELMRYGIFQESKSNSFLNQNIYLSLSGDLSNSVRFTSLFLIINYIYNTFMNLANSNVDNNYRAMRYILLIDEAHVLFKEKKYQTILEKILREIRSKGVSVVLLSQGIEEFNQPSFDFSSMCEMSFLLDIKDKGNSKAINKFLGYSEKESVKVARSLEKIERGQAISSIKEIERGTLFSLKQFKDN